MAFSAAGLEALTAVLLAADTAKDEFIKLPDGLPPQLPDPLRNSIYVRKCYRHLLDHISNVSPNSATVVTGTPGIGKSAFVLLLLCHLAQRNCKVVYQYSSSRMGIFHLLMDFTDSRNVRFGFAFVQDKCISQLIGEVMVGLAGSLELLEGLMGLVVRLGRTHEWDTKIASGLLSCTPQLIIPFGGRRGGRPHDVADRGWSSSSGTIQRRGAHRSPVVAKRVQLAPIRQGQASTCACK